MQNYATSLGHRTARWLGYTLSAAASLLVAATTSAQTAPPPLPSVADNANQLSMAQAIQVVCPNLRALYQASQGTEMPADQLTLFDACAGVLRATSGDTSRSIALQELTGEELNAAQTTSIDFGGLQRANIASRLLTLRQARGSGSVAALSPADHGSLGFSTGGASGDSDGGALGGRLGIFLNGRVGTGEKDTTDLEAGYDVDTTGLTAGLDYRLNENAVIGFAVSYGKSEADFAKGVGLSGGAFDSDGYSAAAFGSWYGERYYIDVIASVGKLDHDSERHITYTLEIPPDPDLGEAVTETYNETARGETESDMVALGASFGYDFGNGPWRFGPLLAISYLEVDVDGFAESGAPGLNLTYGEQEGKSLQLQAGLDVGYSASTSWGVLSPYARLVYINEQENDAQLIGVRYSSDPLGTVFSVASDEPDDSFLRWGVGLSAVFMNGFSAFLDYDSVIELDTVDYGEITAGLRYQFR